MESRALMLSRDMIEKVNATFKFLKLAKSLGLPTNRIPASIICPFHQDSTPSAKIFKDNIWCWVCHKSYTSYDLLRALKIPDYKIIREVERLGVEVVKSKRLQLKVPEDLFKKWKTEQIEMKDYIKELLNFKEV
jgi:ubiquitin C-terminal hydrolase